MLTIKIAQGLDLDRLFFENGLYFHPTVWSFSLSFLAYKMRLTFTVIVRVRDFGYEAPSVISGPQNSSSYYLGHPRLDLLARSLFSLRRQELVPKGKKHSLPKAFNGTIEFNLYSLIILWPWL